MECTVLFDAFSVGCLTIAQGVHGSFCSVSVARVLHKLANKNAEEVAPAHVEAMLKLVFCVFVNRGRSFRAWRKECTELLDAFLCRMLCILPSHG